MMHAGASTRVAVWSGPRNVSTALMRAWGSRADTVVVDEPFYAHYLQHTGRAHPGRASIMAAGEVRWRSVVAQLTGGVPEGRAIYYQKHMAHHLFPFMEGSWMEVLRHVLLIREPRAMLASLLRVLPGVTLPETGLPQQVRLLAYLQQRGQTVPVVVARDVLRDPPGLLRALCQKLGVPFTPEMLTWAPGLRPTDGVWAAHWYSRVAESTGFEPYRPSTAVLPATAEPLLAACQPLYDQLYAQRLVSEG
ncbi:MAG: HAD family hydrolase [Bacteroidota bacterium]